MKVLAIVFVLLAAALRPLPVSRSYAAVPAVPLFVWHAPPTARDYPRAVGVCQVHGVPLYPSDETVIYGERVFVPRGPEEAAYDEAMLTLFPNIATPHYAGTCMHFPTSPDTVVQFLCPKCREARAEWRAARAKK